MKKTLLILFAITIVVELFGQQDLEIGTSYQFNLQRKNSHADAWILHNAEYSQGDDILKWKTSHGSFGSRGIRFSYSIGKGIYFYADDRVTIANNEFTPTTRFFIGNNGNVGVGTTEPKERFDVSGRIRASQGVYATGASNPTSWEANAVDISLSGNNGYLRSRDWAANQWLPLYIQASTYIFNDGNVGIGTINPQSLLAVNGTITTKEVVVTIDGWSDFVFNKDYKLKDLKEVENFIEENNHLPDIPSEDEVLENGIQVGEMNAKLLQKIEELTLYMIDINKEVKALRNENAELKEKIVKMEVKE